VFNSSSYSTISTKLAKASLPSSTLYSHLSAFQVLSQPVWLSSLTIP